MRRRHVSGSGHRDLFVLVSGEENGRSSGGAGLDRGPAVLVADAAPGDRLPDCLAEPIGRIGRIRPVLGNAAGPLQPARIDRAFIDCTYSPDVRGLVAVLGISVAIACAGAAAPAAKDADSSVFGGLGTWVDIYDSGVYRAPEATAARIAARRVTTVWVETANYRASADVVKAPQLGRFVEALHSHGINVVAWYLPGHVDPAGDTRRSLAMLSFRTRNGQAFDGISLNIEGTALRNVALRSRRAVSLARRVRQEAGETPLAIIPFNPRGLERRPEHVAALPVGRARRAPDAFAPMAYTGGAFTGLMRRAAT